MIHQTNQNKSQSKENCGGGEEDIIIEEIIITEEDNIYHQHLEFHIIYSEK